MGNHLDQLISYIAPAAPATRRPADGNEPYLRPEIGFTPKWYHHHLKVDFGENWHTDPIYRKETILQMRRELRHRFPNTKIGMIDRPDKPLDILTGTYGANSVAAIYGIPIIYTRDNWPNSSHDFLSEAQITNLESPNLDTNDHFQNLMNQVELIAETEGRIEGFINWQGVLNNAQRLRGQELFMDMMINPELANHLFECVATTMIDAAKRLHKRQLKSGVSRNFFTMSNCLVNMVSSEDYSQLLLPHDQRISEAFEIVGIHNCSWNATPYFESYSKIQNNRYIDMGQDSDLLKAQKIFSRERRSIMYTPMDVSNKSLGEIKADLENIADKFGPCDIVAADIEIETPDQKVLDLIEKCAEISKKKLASE